MLTKKEARTLARRALDTGSLELDHLGLSKTDEELFIREFGKLAQKRIYLWLARIYERMGDVITSIYCQVKSEHGVTAEMFREDIARFLYDLKKYFFLSLISDVHPISLG